MLNEIERDPDMADIDFITTPVEDGKYGALESGRWDGTIGKLTDDVRNSLIRCRSVVEQESSLESCCKFLCIYTRNMARFQTV